MKRIFFCFFVFTGITIFAQNAVSDYQYIYVPKKFEDFKTDNKYNLNTALAKALTSKKYQILRDTPDNWPVELRADPCKVLTADVKNNSNMLRNRIILEFTDCKKNAVLQNKATSMEKDFDLGYNDALKQALVSVPVSSPQEQISVAAVSGKTENQLNPEKPAETVRKKVKNQKTEIQQTAKAAEPVKATASSDPEPALYIFDQETFQKVEIGNGGFILVSPKSSVPYATFSPSGKSGVYRVSLQNGSMTLGYEENGDLVIEMPKTDGTFVNQVLKKK